MNKPKTWYRYEKGNRKDKNRTICFSQLQNDRDGVFSSEGLTTPDNSPSTPVDSPSLFTVMNESHEIVKDPLDGIVTESSEKKHESHSLQSEDSWDGMHITKQKTPTDAVSPTDSQYSWGNKPASPLSEQHNSPKDDLRLQSEDSWDGMHITKQKTPTDAVSPTDSQYSWGNKPASPLSEQHNSPKDDLRLQSDDSWDGMHITKQKTPTGMGSTNDTKQATLGEAVTSLAGATTNTVNNTVNNAVDKAKNLVKQGKDKATKTLNDIKGTLSKQLDKLQALLDKQQGGKRITKRRKLKIKRKLNKSYKKKKVRRRKNKTRRKMNKRRNKSRRHN